MGGRSWLIAVALGLVSIGCQSGAQRAPASDTPQNVPTTAKSWQAPTTEASTTGPAIPDAAVVVEPGDDLALLAREHPDGTIFFLRSGVHRIDTVVPRPNQSFLGEAGAVVSGARVVRDFEPRGDRWVARQSPAGIEERGKCEDDRPCTLAEELFLDGQPLRRVNSASEVKAGTWYFDLEKEEVLLSVDPTGLLVEMSYVTTAFDRGSTGVTIRGLVIEKFASPGQFGAIMPDKEWTIEGNEIRFNHAIGIKVASGNLVRDNYIHHNGQFGLGGGGTGSVIEGNEIAGNNTAGFSPFWGAGGTKFVHTQDLVVRNNLVYGNGGPGLWTDGRNERVLYEGNTVMDNAFSGIKHELAGSAIIRDNVVLRNGFDHPVPLRGAGILVRESSGVEIVGNLLEGNVDALILFHDADRKNEIGVQLENVIVQGNIFVLGDGLVGYKGDLPGDPILEGNLIFEGNTYVVPEGHRQFLDNGNRFDFRGWVESGRELGAHRVDSLEEAEALAK